MFDVLSLNGAGEGAILHPPGLEWRVSGHASDAHNQLLDPSDYASGGEKVGGGRK